MKMTKSVKILTVILSCLLLIGGVIGISASADDERTVTIAHKNLSYEGAIKVLYAVKTTGLVEGDTIEMNFYNDAEGTALAYTKADSGLDIDFGTEEAPDAYDIIFSDGISPKNMRKTVYAQAVVKDAAGEVVATSDITEYSIWQYAVNRFEKSPSEDQLALYTAMLNYGASVQKVLMDNGKYTADELAAAGGYANEYCGIKVSTVVDGAAVASGETAYYAPGTEVALGAAKVYNNASMFEAYLDADGVQVGVNGWNRETVTAAKPGLSAYTATYITTGELPVTYDGEDLASNYVSSTKTTPSTPITAEFTYTDTKSGANYTIVVDVSGTLNLDTGDGVLNHARSYKISGIKDANGNAVEQTEDGLRKVGTTLSRNTGCSEILYGSTTAGEIKGGSAFSFLNQSSMATHSQLYRHVFETDILYNGNNFTQGWLRNSSGNNLWGFNIKGSSNGLATMTVANGADNSKVVTNQIPFGEWFNLRIEYYDLENDAIAVYVYVNGELCPPPHYDGDAWINYSATSSGDDYIANFYMNFVYDASQITVLYDNTYFATEYVDTTPGTGEYADNAITLDYDYSSVNNKYSNATAMNNALGFYSARYASFNGSTDAGYYSVIASDNTGNNYLLSGTNGNYGGTSVGWSTPVAYTGGTYVFETDLLWNGAQTDVTDVNAVFFRIYDSFFDSSKANHQDPQAISLLRLQDSGVSSDVYKFGDTSKGMATLRKGKWANIRLEVTPLTETTVTNTLYVNGKLIYSADQAVSGTNATSNQYCGAFFFTRSASTTSTEYSFALDNTYLGVKRSSYYEDESVNGTRYSFDNADDVAFDVYNAETCPNGIYAGTPDKATNNTYLNIDENGELLFTPAANTWCGVQFANKGTTAGKTGDKYVIEMDFTWLSGSYNPTRTDGDKQPFFIGFTSNNDNNAYMFAHHYPAYVDDELQVFGAYLEKGKTYNLRLEYTVGSQKVVTYLDNKIVAVVETKAGAASNAEIFKGFGLYYRSGRTSADDPFSCTFDNVFVGLIPATTTTEATE